MCLMMFQWIALSTELIMQGAMLQSHKQKFYICFRVLVEIAMI